MSAFLGPIHFFMYDKILINQKLTFLLEEKFLDKEKREEIENLFPSVLDKNLEEIIDKNNIHNFLNSCVSSVEIRFSFVVKTLLEMGISIDKIKDVAFLYGDSFEKYDITTAKNCYDLLIDILLDGLPCDVSISVVKDEKFSLEFVLYNDIHKEFFDEFKMDVCIYHDIREAFANGILNKYSFRYKNLMNNKKLIEKI